MNEIFGIPMVGLMVVLVAALAVCLGYVGWIALRQPILFRLGIRNLPRRKAQTALIVIGLMLSTLIISASLGTGATLHYSITSDVYRNLGAVDELVVSSPTFDAPSLETASRFDGSAIEIVDAALAGNSDVEGVMPYLETRLPVRNETARQAEPDVVVMGLDPERLAAFGSLKDAGGEVIDAGLLGDGSVVLSAAAADSLDAAVGDVIRLGSIEGANELNVVAIAQDEFLSGFRRGREDFLEHPGLVMNLTSLQTLIDSPNLLSGIAISNAGGVRSGHKLTEDVTAALAGPLAGTGLGVDRVKQVAVDDGEAIAETFLTIFLVLGLFSVTSGLLLIVLIFSMLAAERRSEMGISRAIGTRSSQLTRQFIVEGAGYALIAGLVGALLGAGAAVGIAYAMKWLFGQYVPIEPYFDIRAVVVAYCLGVTITFLTIVVSSKRISRLNVVAAIRDIPEVATTHRSWRSLVLAILAVAAGIGGVVLGLSGDTASLFFVGASLAIGGAALIARFGSVPSRIVFSVSGALLLILWLIPERVGARIWGDLEQGVEMFFLAGVFMVVGATMVISQNLEVLLHGVARFGSVFGSSLPAVRTAVAYPAANKGRTGLTIAMFSLIVFSMVLIGSMSQNYGALYSAEGATAGWDVRATAHSPEVFADFEGELAKAGVDVSQIEHVAITTSPNRESSQVRLAGAESWKHWPVFGAEEQFFAASELTFSERAAGYEDDGAIVAALLADPTLAVIDTNAIPQGGDIGGDADAFKLTGLKSGQHGFAPIGVEIAGPDGSMAEITIIGVISGDVSSLTGLFVGQDTIDAIAPETAKTSYFVALTSGSDDKTMATSIEAAMIDAGIQSVSIAEEVAEFQKEESGFLRLMEGFMALGLIVGLAAIGVISFRAVVERRQQIGVLRAIGFRRKLVSQSFLLETLFVVGVGLFTGTVLGSVLGYNLFTSESTGAAGQGYLIPWNVIGILILGTLTVAALATWIPARQASGTAPAEALRYE